VRRLLEALRGLLSRAREERELAEELRFHLDMETEENVRRGMSPAEARRRAAVAFGGVTRTQEEVREARGLAWVWGLGLDLKLGARMLVKSPGLTLVGVLGMAVAIAIGAGVFALVEGYVQPPLPLEEGGRVVGLETWDTEANGPELHVLHDVARWREGLRSLEDLGAVRTLERNLRALPGGRVAQAAVAEMSASGFRLARVPPALGRTLLPEDEPPGAPPVAVVGHDVWRVHFAGDPGALGQGLELGGVEHTVVGVMPEGFGFPVNFSVWVPLRAGATPPAPGAGPAVRVFARLAPGVSLAQAQAELDADARRAAEELPRTHARLRPGLAPFTAVFGFLSGAGPELVVLQLVVSLLLVVVAVNVAALVYARTARRQGEIAVRTALGAGRARIVTQLFLEALVLCAVAAVLGLALARGALLALDAMLLQAFEGRLPFWLTPGLTPGTVAYVVGLALLGAGLAGAVPGLQATGRHLQARLAQLGGGTGLQLGRTWTALIVAQVAFAVAVLPATVFYTWQMAHQAAVVPSVAAEAFLTATLESDREPPPGAADARAGAQLEALVRRLEAEPEVADVTWGAHLPGQEPTGRYEVEGVAPPTDAAGHAVRENRAEAGFAEAFGVRLLAGRALAPGDEGRAVLVTQSFAHRVLGGGQAVGRRVRALPEGREGEGEGRPEAPPGPWLEVVGVVGDFPFATDPARAEPRLLGLLPPAEPLPLQLAVRVRGTTPAAFGPRLSALTATLDPTLRADEVLPLDVHYSQGEQGLLRMGAWVMALLTLSVLVLSGAGISALMSFTVTRRRREIGVRAALGAEPRHILRSVFARASLQLAAGGALGALVACWLVPLLPDTDEGRPLAFVPVVAVLVTAVGLLAALGPARRGLRISPSEALRAD
jgi:predicted permease